MRRDRTRAMKWVEELALKNPDESVLRESMKKRKLTEKTITDQLRALKKHGVFIPGAVDAKAAMAIDAAAQFVKCRPAPK